MQKPLIIASSINREQLTGSSRAVATAAATWQPAFPAAGPVITNVLVVVTRHETAAGKVDAGTVVLSTAARRA